MSYVLRLISKYQISHQNKGKTKYVILAILLFTLPQFLEAQCAMCRAVLESEENTTVAEGINNGIVYLMAVPYILVAVLFYFIYKKMKS